MPRGQPDYGLYTQTSLAAGIADPGETAARLGSINVYDRRGWTTWLDDFEAPIIKWDRFNAFGGIYPVLTSDFALSGAQSIKLECGLGVGSYSRIIHGFGLVRLGRVGVEFWVQAKSVVNTELRCLVQLSDGTNLTRAELIYNIFAGTISIVTPLGTFVVATGIFMVGNLNYWIPIKLVVDMDTDYYTRLMVASDDIDLSSHELVTVGLTPNKIIDCYLTLYGNNVATVWAYIDNFIYTVAEP